MISIHAPREGCDPGSLERLTAPEFQSTHPARGATPLRPPAPPPTWISIHAPREGCDEVRKRESRARRISIHAPREGCDGNAGRRPGFACLYFNPRTPRGVRRLVRPALKHHPHYFNPRTPRGVRHNCDILFSGGKEFQSTHPARGATSAELRHATMSIFQSTHPARGATLHLSCSAVIALRFQSTHPARGATALLGDKEAVEQYFNPRTPRGVRQQTLPKSREFAWLNLLICTRGRRLSIRKQTRLCSMKLSFMLFGCEPAGEGVSSWTSHATKSKVRLEGRSAYSQSVRSSAHSDFPGNKSGGCPVRDP